MAAAALVPLVAVVVVVGAVDVGEQAAHSGGHVVERRARGGVVRPAALHERVVRLGAVGGPRRAQALGDDAQRRLRGGELLVRQLAGGHLPQHDAERVDVAAAREAAVLERLGRQPAQRAAARLRRVAVVHGVAREAEVGQAYVGARRVDEHVVAFDVAMNHFVRVQVGERRRELPAERAAKRPVELDGVVVEHAGQVARRHVLGEQVHLAAAVGDAVEWNEVVVRERREHANLALQVLHHRLLHGAHVDRLDRELLVAVRGEHDAAEVALAEHAAVVDVHVGHGDEVGVLGRARR
mmetsp:Transcript_4244/g.10291  ORF Transcript_4244/g.10291 Transcript_4244/m.10291 type:complete len:296 (-) Transcript_4244:36-923(-)